MVPISKMRFHDGVSAAEHTGKAWYAYDSFDDGLEPRVADGWCPVIGSGNIQPWNHYMGEGDVMRSIYNRNRWESSYSTSETRTNSDGTVTALGLFTTKEAVEAYIKNPKEFQ